jgi:hypothetical protein
MSCDKVIYVSKEDVRTIFKAGDILESFYDKVREIDPELADDLDISLFYLRRFLHGFRKYIKPKEG